MTRRFRGGLTGGFQYQYAHNTGTTQGSNEAQTAQNTFDFSTEQGANPARHPPHDQRQPGVPFPGDGFWSGGWRLGGILNARSGVPINVTIARPDNIAVNGVTVANIPGGNSRGTQRPDLIPGVDPYLKDGGIRWLNPAAFATPQPGTFGNLPRNFLSGPGFWQVDLMGSKDFRFGGDQGAAVPDRDVQHHQRTELPAAGGFAAQRRAWRRFNDSTAGATFGYMLGPLNRTIGLGTQRQMQLSVRYTF